MNDPRRVPNIETKGLYTTTIPLESLETGCNFINVVLDGFGLGRAYRELLVEVSFDLYEKKHKGKSRCEAQPGKPVSDNNDDNNDGSVLFGKLMRVPYLHYLISSCIDYPVLNHLNGEDKWKAKLQTKYQTKEQVKYKSIVVRNPTQFKSFYGHEQRIFVAENGTILFCRCHLYPEFDCIMQSPKLGYVNYDEDGNGDTEELDYEVPNKPFKYLFKFTGPSVGAIPKGIQVTNFEMLVREEPPEEVREPNGKLKSFKVGNITFYKRITSCVKDRIAKEKKRIRNQQ